MRAENPSEFRAIVNSEQLAADTCIFLPPFRREMARPIPNCSVATATFPTPGMSMRDMKALGSFFVSDMLLRKAEGKTVSASKVNAANSSDGEADEGRFQTLTVSQKALQYRNKFI